jgi:uncharacterized protein (DUF433 family)
VAYQAQSDPLPLREDASGALRVGESRVLFELVIRAFQDGATPESIVQRYPTLSLSDVYAVVAHYLRHRDEVEAYLLERERLAGEILERAEGLHGDLGEIRARLLARRRS